jgi:acyl-CoA thioester hydrolase
MYGLKKHEKQHNDRIDNPTKQASTNMTLFTIPVQIRWSDLDPNFHLRHSVYYDWGAFCRMEFLNSHELTPAAMSQLGIGPVLFREECTFRREILMGDAVTIDLSVTRARKDYSRWSIQHQIKKGDTLCAIIIVDGAWIGIKERRLVTPPEKVHHVFDIMPKTGAFEWQ